MRVPHNEPLGSDTSGDATAEATSPERPLVSGSASADPERRCVLTGGKGPRGELTRLALSPDGVIAPDVLARAPGRGAWIGVTREELEIAIAKGKLKGALARAFKQTVTVPDDLSDRIEAALTRAMTERLGLSLRAGHLLLGTERIAEAARAGKVRWLGHAIDAGGDGVAKLAQAWRVGEDAEGSGQAGQILPLDRAALSVALGRDNVVHLALTEASAAQRVASLLQRLLHFTGAAEAEPRRRGAAPADAGSLAGDDDILTKDV